MTNLNSCQIGLVGLAVMGQNLALNIEEHGFPIAVFNRTTSKVDEFVASNPGKRVTGCHSLEELVSRLERPRRVLLMVQAGAAVDAMIDHLRPLLEAGDILIDGGNSYFLDTERRVKALEGAGSA